MRPGSKTQILASICALALSALACQPVLAIGWREAFVILLLIALLIGPPLYRFFRRIENSRKQNGK